MMFSMDRVTQIMMSHSNAGTVDTLTGARHFFITRAMYEGLLGTMTEARYDQLSQEAWSTFVLPQILSFHTWLREVMTPHPEMDTMINNIIEEIRFDWLEDLASLKVEFLENLA
jgi:hypothetical protein